MSNPCSNSRNGCQNTISQRGSILCDVCIENKKNNSKSRKEKDLFEIANSFQEKNKKLEEKVIDLSKLITSLEFEKSQLQEQLEAEKKKNKDNTNKADYNLHLEKENQRITKLFEKALSELDKLIADKATFQSNFDQLKLNYEKARKENDRYKLIISNLEEANQKILHENQEMLEVQEDLSKKVAEFKTKLENTVNQLPKLN